MREAPVVDVIRTNQILLVVFLVIVSVVLGRVALVQGNVLLGLLIPIIGVVSWMIGRPALLFIGVLFAENGSMLIPGFPSSLGVSQIFQFLLIVGVILYSIISPSKQTDLYVLKSENDKWLKIFVVNLFLIMFVRGAGFRILGGGAYGGTGYIMLLMGIIFYFSAIRLNISDRQIKILLWVSLVGALIPMFVQILVYFSPSAFYGLTRFIASGSDNLAEEQFKEGGIERWTAFRVVSYALVPIAFVIVRKKWVQGLLILLAFLLVGMAGFRSRMLTVGALVFFSSISFSKNKGRTILLWAIVGIIFLCVLMVVAPMLPRAIQRSISFIPFLPVDIEIAERAGNSGTWRFDLWRDYCIPNVSKYLWVGRGVSRDIMGFAWLQNSWYGSSEFFYHMGRYHSGPFSLLLDYGLLGTISFTVFFLSTIVDAWRVVRIYAAKADNLISRYYVFLSVLMTYQIFHFYFVFGDVQASLFNLLLIAVQLRVFKKNVIVQHEVLVEDPDE